MSEPALARKARCGSLRHGVPARDRHRLRHHGRAARRRERSARASRQHLPDGRHAGGSHHHARADFGRTPQSRRDARIPGRRRNRAYATPLPTRSRSLPGLCVGVFVAHMMFDLPLLQVSAKARSGLGQAFSEWTATFGLVATILAHRAREAVRAGGVGRSLYRCRLLVHRLDLVRQSGRYHRARHLRYIRRHTPTGRTAVRGRTGHGCDLRPCSRSGVGPATGSWRSL